MLAAQTRVNVAPRAFALPGDAALAPREICALSGLTPHAWCPSRRREWLPRRDEPLMPCSWHHLTDEGLQVVWPAPYRQWAQQQRLTDASSSVSPTPRVIHAAAVHAVAVAALQIASPPSGATYLIDPTLRREFQTLPLRVTSDRPTAITWSIDGRVLGNAASDGGLTWPLAPGRHQIRARDSRGNSTHSTITVR